MTRSRSRIFVVIGVFPLLSIIGLVVWFGYQVSQVRPNAYAVWWTADLVIEHMERHGGAWPQSWEELRATSDQAYKGAVSTNRDGIWIAESRPRARIDELQQRVEIDWNADPRELAKTDFTESGPPFRVIWLRNGRSTHYSGKEPNDMVLEYLKWRERQIAEPDDVPE